MASMTNFLENELIDHVFRARPYTLPAIVAVGLLTAAPGEASNGTEVSGGSYARVALNPHYSHWSGTGAEATNVDSTGLNATTNNLIAITFASPTANWGTVTHFGIFDALSGGNLLFYGSAGQAKTVNNGDPAPSFAIGALTIQLDN